MAKNPLTLDLATSLRRKEKQRKMYMALSVSKKLPLLDQLHENAPFLASLKPKRKVAAR